MALGPTPCELPWEASPKQIDRPATGSLLILAQGVGKLVQIGHNAQSTDQRNGVVDRAVVAPIAAFAVKRVELKPGLLTVDRAEVVMKPHELHLSLSNAATPGTAALEAEQGFDGVAPEAQLVVEDFGNGAPVAGLAVASGHLGVSAWVRGRVVPSERRSGFSAGAAWLRS